ncbi:PREDICTED: APOPT family protein CG14806, mitochondrial isoform X2 [Rhagoletis zephyria]|uniref:APOPT family protein CG14806, mitochondrial isoform X2 n=1 Tax=Rhagoletis zephyria TaxID=28612 RepID=UPI000811977E|nr:PREDICTED: APOPT family protein CG14806, mitochondrial isoform X2 [Rhagoletis zephyria]
MYFITIQIPNRSFGQLKNLYRYRGKISGLNERPDPTAIPQDYVGPPDKLSNIRPFVRHIPKDETDNESRLRVMQEEVENWNHEFWSRHNQSFYNERQEFIGTSKTEVSADKMSEFYKTFLDKNRKTHLQYNYIWYKKNFEMLKLSFRVYLERLLRKQFLG